MTYYQLEKYLLARLKMKMGKTEVVVMILKDTF